MKKTWHVTYFGHLLTEANPLVGMIHDRMPVILDPEQYEAWLDVDGTSAEDEDASAL